MRERRMRANGTWYKNKPKAEMMPWINLEDLPGNNEDEEEPKLQGDYPDPTRNGFECVSFRDSEKLGFFTSREKYIGWAGGGSAARSGS